MEVEGLTLIWTGIPSMQQYGSHVIFLKQGSVLVEWAPWLNKVNSELKPSGRSSQSLSWCPWLELVCPWVRCQPLQSCPSAFHWSSLTICCYPYILFGGAFRSPNALTLGYPFWLALVLEFFVLGLFLLFFYRYKNVLDHKNGELPPECTPNIDRLGEQSTNTLYKISKWKNSVSEV